MQVQLHSNAMGLWFLRVLKFASYGCLRFITKLLSVSFSVFFKLNPTYSVWHRVCLSLSSGFWNRKFVGNAVNICHQHSNHSVYDFALSLVLQNQHSQHNDDDEVANNAHKVKRHLKFVSKCTSNNLKTHHFFYVFGTYIYLQ